MLYRTFPCSECVIVLPWRTLWKILILAENNFSFLSCKHVLLMIPLIFSPSWRKSQWMSKPYFFLKFHFSSTSLLSKLCMGNKKVLRDTDEELFLFSGCSVFHVNAHAHLSSQTWVGDLGFWRCLIHCHFCVVTHKSLPFMSKFQVCCVCLMLACEERLNESSDFLLKLRVWVKKKSFPCPTRAPRLLQSMAKCTNNNTGTFSPCAVKINWCMFPTDFLALCLNLQ